MLFDVSGISAPELMTPLGLKWHLKFGTSLPLALRFLKSVELAVCGHDPTTRRGADLDSESFERRMDTIFTKPRDCLGVCESRCGPEDWLCVPPCWSLVSHL